MEQRSTQRRHHRRAALAGFALAAMVCGASSCETAGVVRSDGTTPTARRADDRSAAKPAAAGDATVRRADLWRTSAALSDAAGRALPSVVNIATKLGRYHIRVERDSCISCGNCSTYCEMGIDVRAYAQRNQSFTRASCVGCGACAHVCPRGVLRLENRPRWSAREAPSSARQQTTSHPGAIGAPDAQG